MAEVHIDDHMKNIRASDNYSAWLESLKAGDDIVLALRSNFYSFEKYNIAIKKVKRINKLTIVITGEHTVKKDTGVGIKNNHGTMILPVDAVFEHYILNAKRRNHLLTLLSPMRLTELPLDKVESIYKIYKSHLDEKGNL